MQRNEIIISQFIKTIKDSQLDVQGDPVLLDKVFKALEKKKKRKRFLAFFMIFTVVLSGVFFLIWNPYFHHNNNQGAESMVSFSKHTVVNLSDYKVYANNDAKHETVEVTASTKKVTSSASKKENHDFTISYKFNNHQVDVTKVQSEEFIQINVFGSDGSEIDVLKTMEELKKSYQNKELYVDSTNNQPARQVIRTVRRPQYN